MEEQENRISAYPGSGSGPEYDFRFRHVTGIDPQEAGPVLEKICAARWFGRAWCFNELCIAQDPLIPSVQPWSLTATLSIPIAVPRLLRCSESLNPSHGLDGTVECNHRLLSTVRCSRLQITKTESWRPLVLYGEP